MTTFVRHAFFVYSENIAKCTKYFGLASKCVFPDPLFIGKSRIESYKSGYWGVALSNRILLNWFRIHLE